MTTVSDVLLEILAAHGVRHLFGIPGDAINDVMDAVRRQDRIAFISVRHEEAGAFAASAQAKLTGGLAACVGTAGPGAIHLLNGLSDAKLDHAPVLAITGQVATGFIGTQYHQEVRLERLFADVAVYTQTVTTERQIPDVILEACHAAVAHRGVAHVAIATDVSGRTVSFDGAHRLVASLPARVLPADDDCRAAAAAIDAAERPVILAGIGCRQAREELIAFADAVKAPIVRSLKAKDFIDDDHPLCIGGLGLLGGKPAVAAMEAADLLIMVGTDFPYREFYPDKAKVIQIDIEPTRIGRRHPVDIGLVGDAAATLDALRRACRSERSGAFLEQMRQRMQDWRAEQRKLEERDDTPLHPARVMRAIADAAPEKAVFLSDTGTATAWTARHLIVGPDQRYALSGGLASMAFALPAAIGAQLALPDRRAVAIAGDGGFAMLMADFVTAVRYRLPIVVVVLNNRKLGFIQLEQEAKGLPEWGTELTNPDFAAFARACGGAGHAVRTAEELEAALAAAFADERPSVIDVAVDPDALIMPPEIDLATAARFGLAKLREAFLAAGERLQGLGG